MCSFVARFILIKFKSRTAPSRRANPFLILVVTAAVVIVTIKILWINLILSLVDETTQTHKDKLSHRYTFLIFNLARYSDS